MCTARLLLPLLLLVAACPMKREPPPDHGPAPSSTLTGATPKQMRNCPSAVASAKTLAQPTNSGIDVVITSDDLDARQRIHSLAELQSHEREPIWMMPAHTGMHGGPGTIGRCPIIHANTTVSVETIPDGVRVHVVAKFPPDIAELQRATDERARTFSLPSS